MEASVRAIHIATVIRLINQSRPFDDTHAAALLKKAIKQAAVDLKTESRRVHRNVIWALDYRARGAQDRAAMDLIDPSAPVFRMKVKNALSPFDAAFVVKALDEATTASQVVVTIPDPTPAPIASGPTTTATWLDEQIAKGLLDRLTNTVRTRYPIEDIEDVRGEVHLRIAHWAAKGSFDTHIESGHPPSVSRMAAWVGNRIKSSLGRRGQDALWRQMRGSRTEIEFRKGEVHPESVKPEEVFQVALEGGEDGVEVQRVIIDPKSVEAYGSGPHPEAETIRSIIRSIIRSSRPNAAQRYFRVLDAMVENASRGTIAEEDGCSVSRAGKLTARVRADLRDAAWSTVSDARKILRYIVEEPFITYQEICEDLRMGSEDVDRGIRLLLDPEIGYVSEASGRSFTATEQGLDAATAETIGGAVGRIII